MAPADSNTEKLAFDDEYKKMVQYGVELRRFKPDILGPSIADYRESPAGPEVADTLEMIKEFLIKDASKYGITEGDFWRDVERHFGKEQKVAKRADEINFYDQTERELELKRNADNLRTNAAGEEIKYPVHEIFQKTLRKLGFLPKYKGQFLKIFPKIGLGRDIKGKYKGEKTKPLGAELAPGNFEELEKEILEKNQELAEIDAKLAEYADEISKEKAKLGNAKLTDDQEEQIQKDIASISTAITSQALYKTQTRDKVQEMERKQNLILRLIKDELDKESKVIEKKWGKKIKKLIKDRQKLIAHLDKLVNGGSDHKIAELRIKIRDIDSELDKLKTNIINYKAKRPIFLYERFVRTLSIPVLKPKGQSSTILGGMEMPEVKGPAHKIPKK